jgi:hypothetical protein
MRDGQKVDIAAEELVVGDIVFIKIGDKAPAGQYLSSSISIDMRTYIFDRHSNRYSCPFGTKFQSRQFIVDG